MVLTCRRTPIRAARATPRASCPIVSLPFKGLSVVDLWYTPVEQSAIQAKKEINLNTDFVLHKQPGTEYTLHFTSCATASVKLGDELSESFKDLPSLYEYIGIIGQGFVPCITCGADDRVRELTVYCVLCLTDGIPTSIEFDTDNHIIRHCNETYKITREARSVMDNIAKVQLTKDSLPHWPIVTREDMLTGS